MMKGATLGLGLEYDADMHECHKCGEVVEGEAACACCYSCGGSGRYTTGLGAGKGYLVRECETCEGTGRARAEDDADENEPEPGARRARPHRAPAPLSQAS